jgi:hypothetical protein
VFFFAVMAHVISISVDSLEIAHIKDTIY